MTRRTKAEIDHIKRSIFNLCHRYHPMTVRQLFYALTVEGVVDKTEASYKSTVCRLTARMRLDGDLPWHWLADNTRWMRKPDTYGSLSDCLEQAQRAYRRSLWDPNTNDEYVEVWLEKYALAGVLYEVTSEYDVPLMVTRGYPSLTYLHSSAMGIKRELEEDHGDKPPSTTGDFDPSVPISAGQQRHVSVSLWALVVWSSSVWRSIKTRSHRWNCRQDPQKLQTAVLRISASTTAARLMPSGQICCGRWCATA